MAGLVVVGLLGLFFWLSGRWTHLYLFALLSFLVGLFFALSSKEMPSTLALPLGGILCLFLLVPLAVLLRRWFRGLLYGLALPLLLGVLFLTLRLFSPIQPVPLLVSAFCGILLSWFFPKTMVSLWSATIGSLAMGFALRSLLGRTPLPGFPELLGVLVGTLLQCSLLGRWEKERRGFWSRFDPERGYDQPVSRTLSVSLRSLFFLIPLLFLLSVLTPTYRITPGSVQAARMERLSQRGDKPISGGLVWCSDNLFYLTGLRRKAPAWVTTEEDVKTPFHILRSLPLLDKGLLRIRSVKDLEEVETIATACFITTESLKRVLPLVISGTSEGSLAKAVEEEMVRLGAEKVPAFSSIVAAGANAVNPHYGKRASHLRAGELLVVDIGCRYKGYCSDLTRTLPINGSFSYRQKVLYEAVLSAQKAALSVLREGVTLREVEEEARKSLREKNLDKYFIHGLSHHIGISVHDPIITSPDEPLKEGMVISIEPGVYIKEEGIGIRIEETVLLTTQGYRSLTEGFPREVEEVEKLIRASRRAKATPP
ncbi:MAG TPA: Xaa-Pro peptidase family protein [Candidatus Aminicenantes bacterium]|nr:Xaa-Pro peptidase family protein [Candidatus Aminicenantes bacterium]